MRWAIGVLSLLVLSLAREDHIIITTWYLVLVSLTVLFCPPSPPPSLGCAAHARFSTLGDLPRNNRHEKLLLREFISKVASELGCHRATDSCFLIGD
jgi:hypothetical protein